MGFPKGRRTKKNTFLANMSAKGVGKPLSAKKWKFLVVGEKNAWNFLKFFVLKTYI